MKLKQNCVYVPNPIFTNPLNQQQNLSDHFAILQCRSKQQRLPSGLLSDISNRLCDVQLNQIQQDKQSQVFEQISPKKKKYSPRKIKKRAIFQFDFDEDSIKNQQELQNQPNIQESTQKENFQYVHKEEVQVDLNLKQSFLKAKRFNFLHNQLNFSSSDQEYSERVQSEVTQKQLGIFFPKLRPKMIAGFSDQQEQKQQKNQIKQDQEQKQSVSEIDQLKQSILTQQKSKSQKKSTRHINTTQFRREFVQKDQEYLKISLPPNTSIQLVLKRDKSKAKSQYIQYQVFDAKNFKHILTIKKSQNYQIFAKSNVQNPKANPHQLYHTATLSSNFFGNTFNLYYPPKNSGLKNQQISSTITYEVNFLGFNGPRRMNIYLTKDPLVLGDINLQQFYSKNQQKNGTQIQKYINKTAKWNSDVKSYVLNLKGKAKLSSVKNFVIVKENQKNKPEKSQKVQQQKTYAIFGKIGKDTFNLVVSSPFSILQGVATGLSTFQRKMTCQ